MGYLSKIGTRRCKSHRVEFIEGDMWSSRREITDVRMSYEVRNTSEGVRSVSTYHF
jgi:hypothetical protein